jgi:hypothetical protein
MPELKGVITTDGGTVLPGRILHFYKLTAALYSGEQGIQPTFVKVVTDFNGRFNVNLAAGNWEMAINGYSTLQLTMPSSGQQYKLSDVITAIVPTVPTVYLPLAGGTMTGFIILHSNPTAAMHPVTLQYAQANFAPLSHVGSSGTSEHAVATTLVAGFMSTSDKSKLDGIGSGANVTSVFGRTGVVVAATNDYTWAQIDKSTSSLADITTRSAGDLSSGTLLAARMPALTGDVTSSSGTVSTSIAARAVTFAKLQAIATARILGRNTGGSGDVEELAASTVRSMLSIDNVENTALSTWAGSTNITTLGTISTGTWNGSRIGLSYLTTIATARLLGRNTAGTGDIEELSAATAKTLLSLNNVENTALSTWAGSTNITTLGTISTGTWNGSRIAFDYLTTIATARILGRNTGGSGNIEELSAATTKSLLSLNNVENTALSTWAGSTNLTTLGTISAGTWNGSTIGLAYGGTGDDLSSDANYSMYYMNGSFTSVSPNTSTTKKFLRMTGTGAAGQAPDWDTVVASDIASGTIATARLGSGTANSSKFLRGDQAWTEVTEVGTITSGSWHANIIDHQWGGTGADLSDDTTYPVLGIVYKATVSAFGVTNTSNSSVLVTNGSGTPSLSTNIPSGVQYNSLHIVGASASTKTTAGAPYANDGYVSLTINGTTHKFMTTA